ncbi:hypothetical protein Pmani_032737 [Petrolisthes manimaculis]|uniref:Uncharacterized protein n=1 Tax=Petrolisthes manimaculis TaxID=1843537 RepID=A0AAE1TTH2_9EUCA|nr:hypothetical protein Pmani_032737 [Petrolisthes manimaculis]
MLHVPAIQTPPPHPQDEDENVSSPSSRSQSPNMSLPQNIQVPVFSLQSPPDDTPTGDGDDGRGSPVILDVPEMGSPKSTACLLEPPASGFYQPHLLEAPGTHLELPGGRLEPPRTLHFSLPPFPQHNVPSLLQVPITHGPRRRHSWICR